MLEPARELPLRRPSLLPETASLAFQAGSDCPPSERARPFIRPLYLGHPAPTAAVAAAAAMEGARWEDDRKKC